MAQTVINVGAVIGLSPAIASVKSAVSNTRLSLDSTHSQVDGRILSRNNIGERFSIISSQLSAIESQIQNIKTTVEDGANSYYRAETRVVGMARALTGQMREIGIIGLGAAGMASAVSKKQIGAVKSMPTFERAANDTPIGVTYISGEEVNVLKGKIERKAKFKWKPREGDAEIEKSNKFKGGLADREVNGKIGPLGGSFKGTIGAVEATGKLAVSLFKDGKLSPAAEFKVGGKGAAIKEKGDLQFGDDDNNIHAKADVSVLGGEAEIGAGLGVITYEDESTGETKSEFGVESKFKGEAYFAKGKITSGFTLCGVKIDVGLEGKAGALGATAESRLTTGGLSGKLGGSLGLGTGVELSIDWSDFDWGKFGWNGFRWGDSGIAYRGPAGGGGGGVW